MTNRKEQKSMKIIYARQSVFKQDSISIETQIEICRKYTEPGDDITVYADKGYSGSNTDRPQFQQMLLDIEKNGAEKVIVYRLDRISRSVLDFSNLYEFFKEYKVEFVSTNEQFDTSTPMGEAMLEITMVFAQLERESTQQRILDNYYERGKNGMYLGGQAPYGFDLTAVKDGKRKLKLLAPGCAESATLVRMFRLYGNKGYTLGGIAKELNEEQIPSPNGGEWKSETVSRVLRNPAAVKADFFVFSYYNERGCKFTNEASDFVDANGLYLYGKRATYGKKTAPGRKYSDVSEQIVTIAPHKGLVSSELFLRCQRRLDENLDLENKKHSQITWLSRLTFCEACGGKAVPKSCKNGAYHYLRCTNGNCTTKTNLGKMSELEAAVGEHLLNWADKHSQLEFGGCEEDENETNSIRCQIADTKNRIERLIETAAESKTITAKYLNEEIEKLDRQCGSLEAKLQKLIETASSSSSKGIDNLREDWGSLSVSEKNQIAEALIEKIVLSPGRAEIKWKYNFDG